MIPAHRRDWHWLLTKAATELYGSQAVAHKLAADVGIGPRAVQRWLNGQNPVPEFIWPMLLPLLRTKIDMLQDLMTSIEATYALDLKINPQPERTET